ncbi:MAG TPA: hypothetical protein VIL03_05825 [Clostridia bacterium]
MTKTYKPGQKVPFSGQAAVIDADGNPTGQEVTVVKGEPFPPTRESGYAYEITDKTKHN